MSYKLKAITIHVNNTNAYKKEMKEIWSVIFPRTGLLTWQLGRSEAERIKRSIDLNS